VASSLTLWSTISTMDFPANSLDAHFQTNGNHLPVVSPSIGNRPISNFGHYLVTQINPFAYSAIFNLAGYSLAGVDAHERTEACLMSSRKTKRNGDPKSLEHP
jgi:hypothetical protein